MHVLAQEIGPRGVTIKAILPTAVDGAGYFITAGADDPLRVEFQNAGPLGSKMGSVTDIADAVEYFVGNLSRWVSGQQLVVSRGAPS